MVLGASPLAERGLGQGWRNVKLLPLHSFEIETNMRAAEAQRAIAAHTVVRKRLLQPPTPNPADEYRFEGEVSGSGFKIMRNPGYRNSFMPVISGEINSGGRGARIAIRMTLRPGVIFFLGLFGLVLLSFLTPLLSEPLSLEAVQIVSFFPLLMLGFMYALTMGAFWHEAAKQERALRDVFHAL